MYLYLIFIILFVVSLVCLIIFKIIGDRTMLHDMSTPFNISAVATVIFGGVLIFMLVVTIAYSAPKGYIELQWLYDDLTTKYEQINSSDASNNNAIITKILEYNEKVRNLQYKANSPWLNWFVNVDLAKKLQIINF